MICKGLSLNAHRLPTPLVLGACWGRDLADGHHSIRSIRIYFQVTAATPVTVTLAPTTPTNRERRRFARQPWRVHQARSIVTSRGLRPTRLSTKAGRFLGIHPLASLRQVTVVFGCVDLPNLVRSVSSRTAQRRRCRPLGSLAARVGHPSLHLEVSFVGVQPGFRRCYSTLAPVPSAQIHDGDTSFAEWPSTS